ncbi:MAG: dihydrodipicolinate synthase family protein [Christensenellales bacterium]|jgi:4-hydroxy-2-oxoglutarate aldolase
MDKASIKETLRGVFAPINTPFDEKGNVDYDGLKENMKTYAASPMEGYLALGSNGENKSLLPEEKRKVLEIIINGKGAHQRVMVGCIAESTLETIMIAKEAEELGADFITLLSPCYFKSQMTDAVLETYFSDVADAVSKPCLLYNAPQFSGGIVLSNSLVKKLAQHGNIAGVKDSGSAATVDGYLFNLPNDFAVLAGSINFFIPAMINGAAGGIISLANIFPNESWKLYDLMNKKQYNEAFEYYEKIRRVSRAVSSRGSIPATKAAMDVAGLAGGYPRRPLAPISDQLKAEIKEIFKAEGMI